MTDNGKLGGCVKWPQLWMITASCLTLGAGVLALHSASTHGGAFRRDEQRQFEKRIVERLQRIEHGQEKLQATQMEILKRVK